MRCQYCHHLLNRTAAYCPHCGKPVAQNSCSLERINLKVKSVPARWVVLLVLLILLLIGGEINSQVYNQLERKAGEIRDDFAKLKKPGT